MTRLDDMLSDLHVKSLNWFQDNAFDVHAGWPVPIVEDGYHVVNKAKGIDKPKGSEHALSVRISADNYSNTGPDVYADQSWRLVYHQELRANGGDPAQYATNKGLLKCMNDGVPVGVLKQLTGKPASTYIIFGLGLVTAYSDGFFIIEGPAETVAVEPPFGAGGIAEVLPGDVSTDDRQRVLAELIRRQGQGKFRRSLLQAYDSKCAVTGCDIVEILDAAHILPHTGSASNNIQNGLLLRTDIHTLFDLGLLQIHPDSFKVSLVPAIANCEPYGSLNGVVMRLPPNPNYRPSSALLKAKQNF